MAGPPAAATATPVPGAADQPMSLRAIVQALLHPPRHVLRFDFAREEPSLVFFLVLAFFTVSFFTQLGARLEFLGAIRHEMLLGIVLLGLSALHFVNSPPDLGNEQVFLTATGLFVLVLASQIPLAADPGDAWHTFNEWLLKYMLFFSFIVSLVRSPRMVFLILAAYFFSMFWVYQEAVRGLITGGLVWMNQGIHRLHGAVPMYEHPNGLSLIACTSLPFIFNFLPVFRRNRLVLLFLAVTAVLAGLCIVNTGSRAGYVGLIALLPYWILDGPGRMRRAVIVFALAAALVPALPEQYVERFASISGEEVTGRSREARIQILLDAWEVFQRYPFGAGIEGFQVVRLQMFGRVQDTHNLYAQVATHLGVQGLAAFFFFVGSMYMSLNRVIVRMERTRRGLQHVLRTRRDPGLRRGIAAFVWELAVVHASAKSIRMLVYFLLVNGLFAHTLYHVIWWFLAALTLATSAVSHRLESTCRARARTVLDEAPAVEV